MSVAGKYDGCERCGKLRLKGELLSAVDCWEVSRWDGRRRPSYRLVCGDCYDARRQWCVDAFPDSCESCGSEIPADEHYFEREHNRDGEKIISRGLAPDETCRIVCVACYRRVSEA